jgi:hypothetical protein
MLTHKHQHHHRKHFTPPQTVRWQYGQSVGSFIIFCMIVVGNLSILHRLKSCRRRRSNVNYFIVQLAIAGKLLFECLVVFCGAAAPDWGHCSRVRVVSAASPPAGFGLSPAQSSGRPSRRPSPRSINLHTR